MVFWCLSTVCSTEDYYSPILYLETKQRHPSPSLVAFYDAPGKIWAASILLSPCLLGILKRTLTVIRSKMGSFYAAASVQSS